MLIYQVRPRAIKFVDAEAADIRWPAEAAIRFYLKPPQPFGMEAGGGRTAVRAVAATMTFSGNTGRHFVTSKKPLRPLDVLLEQPGRIVSLKGNVLTVKETFESQERLLDALNSIYFGVPMILNLSFADPPIVERVEGELAGQRFRWELIEWRLAMSVTTQEHQEQRVADAWQRMGLFSEGRRRRLLAALHYFHVACRLERRGESPGEFLAEVLLNLAKTLEALFPAMGDVRSIDAARAGLREFGIADADIEGNFIPAIVLRNNIGVGHVVLALFKQNQLSVLHAYVERAEFAFRDLLDRMVRRIEAGEYEVPPYELEGPGAEVLRIIERLENLEAPS